MAPSAGFDRDELEAFFRRDVDSDTYDGITSIPHVREPLESLALTLELANLAPDDDAVCWLEVAVLEPLLELHWKALGDAVDRALAASDRLRKALSCVDLSGVPSRVEDRWRRYVSPDDDIGHRPRD
jgi:hypothetical protein